MSRYSLKISLYAAIALPVVLAGCSGKSSSEGSLGDLGPEILDLASYEPYYHEYLEDELPIINTDRPSLVEPDDDRSGDELLEESTVSIILPDEIEEAEIPETVNNDISPLSAEEVRAAILLDGCSKAVWYYGNKPVCEEWEERDWDYQGGRHWDFIDRGWYSKGWDTHGPRGIYDSHDDGRFEYYRWYGEGGGYPQGDSKTDWHWEARFIRNFYDVCVQEYEDDLNLYTICALPPGVFTDYIDGIDNVVHCEGYWTGKQCSTSIHWSTFARFCSSEGKDALFCQLLGSLSSAIIDEDVNEREKLEFEGAQDWAEAEGE